MCRTRRSARATSWAVPQTGRRRALASLAEVRARLACLRCRGFRVRRPGLTPLVHRLPAATARYQGGGGVNTVFNFFAQDEARGGAVCVRRCRLRSRLTTHLFLAPRFLARRRSRSTWWTTGRRSASSLARAAFSRGSSRTATRAGATRGATRAAVRSASACAASVSSRRSSSSGTTSRAIAASATGGCARVGGRALQPAAG